MIPLRRFLALAPAVLLLTSTLARAQQFPLQPGQWTGASKIAGAPGKGMEFFYCLNNETWLKALVANAACKVRSLSSSSTGSSYDFDCLTSFITMKGHMDISYDGMKHMVSRATFESTIGGTTATSNTVTEWHWNGPACNPSEDMNLQMPPEK